MVYQHVQDAPVPPSQLPEGHHIPQELDGLVMRSLAKDPDDRFQSAEEMRGLVQYALQMLHDQGPNTGTWNTGPVTMSLPHGRGGAAQTTAMPMGPAGGQQNYPAHASTSQFQQPMVPPLNPDDGSAFPGGGGYDNHGHGGGPGGRDGYDDRGGSRWKLWLFAVLAIVAIAGGVAYAVNSGSHKTTDDNTPKTVQSSSGGQPSVPSEQQSTPSRETPSTHASDDYTPTPGRSKFTPSSSPSPSTSFSPSPSASKSSPSPSASKSSPSPSKSTGTGGGGASPDPLGDGN